MRSFACDYENNEQFRYQLEVESIVLYANIHCLHFKYSINKRLYKFKKIKNKIKFRYLFIIAYCIKFYSFNVS
jgi:hypothetical protein